METQSTQIGSGAATKDEHREPEELSVYRTKTSMEPGTEFESDTLVVTEDLTRRFARAVNDFNPWYFDGGTSSGPIAPPMFGIVPAMRLFTQAIADGRMELDEQVMVHGEQDMCFLSCIRPGDVLSTTGRIVAVRERSTGLAVDIDVQSNTAGGEERVRQRSTIFVKAGTPGAGSRSTARTTTAPLATASMTVAPDQTLRYAAASFTAGIRVHEDEDFARAAGYETVFLQGQCTMAFAAQAVVEKVADGDPRSLRRLKVRFARPVYPGDVISTNIWTGEQDGGYAFESVNQNGDVVLASGIAELRRSKR